MVFKILEKLVAIVVMCKLFTCYYNLLFYSENACGNTPNSHSLVDLIYMKRQLQNICLGIKVNVRFPQAKDTLIPVYLLDQLYLAMLVHLHLVLF
jgi:hypothetical protein